MNKAKLNDFLETAISYMIGISIGGVIWIYLYLVTVQISDNPIIRSLMADLAISRLMDWNLNKMAVLPLGAIAILQIVMVLVGLNSLPRNWPIFSNIMILVSWTMMFPGSQPRVEFLTAATILVALNSVSNVSWVVVRLKEGRLPENL